MTTKGETEEALGLVDQAIKIDLAARNPHVAEDVAIRSFVVKYRDPSASAFDRWEELPPDLRSKVVVHWSG